MTDLVTADAQGNNPAIAAPTNATFTITDTKLYVPVITLSAENDYKLLEQLKTGFNRKIKWSKYRSEVSNQAKNSNFNYLIYAAFTKVDRLFVLSYKNEEDRTSFSKYYVPCVEIKDFNELIEMSRNNDYTTGNLLDYEYFSKHYKLIAIDLSKQIELENPDLRQQINFIGRLERKEAATIFFIIEKSERTTIFV